MQELDSSNTEAAEEHTAIQQLYQQQCIRSIGLPGLDIVADSCKFDCLRTGRHTMLLYCDTTCYLIYTPMIMFSFTSFADHTLLSPGGIFCVQ